MKTATASVAVVLFGPRGHGGFNQAGLAGAERARALGAAIDVHWCEPPADRADFLRDLARRGYGLIVAHGGQGDAPVAAVAHEFVTQSFAITQGHFLAPNVACYEVLQEHSAFLAGVLAAATTRTGVVAHMSGERVLPGLKGRAAFADGVQQQDPAVRLLTLFCGNQHDEALAYRVVSAQADAGADLLFAMIDGGRPGAIRACRERGVQQIGNVLDWTEREPDVFIASALADSGYCIELAVQDWLADRLCCGAVRAIGLEAPAQVGLAVSPRASAAALARVAHFRQALLSGSLQPRASYDGPEMSLPAA